MNMILKFIRRAFICTVLVLIVGVYKRKMPKINHIHQLVRVKGSKTQYKCAYPICNFVWYKKFLIGKLSICNGCAEEFVTDEYSLSRAVPKCVKCRSVRRDKEKQHTIEQMQKREKEDIRFTFLQELQEKEEEKDA